MEVQIAIESRNVALNEVKRVLEAWSIENDTDLMLEMRDPTTGTRGLDPTILVAIVGASGAVLGALITALVQVSQQISSKTIVLQSEGGRRLEVPADISSDELDELIEKVRGLDEKLERITLLS